MPPKKRSFFDRLSGALPADDYDNFEDDAPRVVTPNTRRAIPALDPEPEHAYAHEDEPVAEGQLPVDMYQTSDSIVIRAFVAGVRPEEMNVSISRDVVEIDGSREERDQVADNDYTYRELFWGSFARTIPLPEEIDVDGATAGAKDGLLTLVLPKLDKTLQTKLRVKAG